MSTLNRQENQPIWIRVRLLGGVRASLRTLLILAISAGLGAGHGLALWAIGTAVCWALAGPWFGVLVSIGLGLVWSLRKHRAVSLAGLLGWGMGGGQAVILLQTMGGTVDWPLTGVMAWYLSGSTALAVLRTLRGEADRDSLLAEAAGGVVGATLGWTLAALLAAVSTTALGSFWGWVMAAAGAVALAAVLEKLPEGTVEVVFEAIKLGGYVGILAGTAALLSPEGGPVGWVLAAIPLWLLSAFCFLVPEWHSKDICSVAISPDGWYALSGSADTAMHWWDLKTCRLLNRYLGHRDTVHSVAFSPDGLSALSGSADATLRLVDLVRDEEIARFSGHTAAVRSVAFSHTGKQVLSGSADRTVRLWNALTGDQLACFTGHTDVVHGVAFTPSGQRAISASADGTVRLWNLASGREVGQLVLGCAVHAVAFAPFDKLVATGDAAGLRLWDVANRKKLKELHRFGGHDGAVYCVAWSADGGRLLSGGADRTVRLWDVASGRQLWCYSGHTRPVRSVAFGPDGRQILSGGDDCTLRLLSLPEEEVATRWERVIPGETP